MDMRYWKRILSCLLAGSMAFALAACSRQGAAPTQEAEETPAVSQAPAAGTESPAPEGTAAQEEAQPAGESGNTLVVYFSATGHTEAVADHIAQATGGIIGGLSNLGKHWVKIFQLSGGTFRFGLCYIQL